ncbi:MAG: extracellular solute-binding protein [Ruminococcus sp.]|nr:extracellular solute-binding protein [Ruminococcus sp.]
MKNIKKTLAGIIAVTTVMTSAVSCRKNVTGNLSVETDDKPIAMLPESEEPEGVGEPADISGTEIVWLSDYDLNPTEKDKRSVALSLFEDVFGGKVKFVYTPAEERFDKLASMILAGDEVDMVEYDPCALPDGVKKNQYEPLDPYFNSLEINSSIWDDMSDVIDMFEYNDQHYVIPYSLSNPVVLTYSRKMIEENKLDDPYELYEKGKWDWDTFMEMMEKFKTNTGGYGINGFVGNSLIHSTGFNIVNYKNGKLINNINTAPIKEAETFMQEIANKKLYSTYRNDSFPSDNDTLFFAAPFWTIGVSNVRCPDMDFMAIPFPQYDKAKENYIVCDFNAKMLVKNSQKGHAVATYIKCERFAVTQEDYKEPAKEFALLPQKNSKGATVSQLTPEQYDILQEYTDPTEITPVVDFAYGMGDRLYSSAGSDGIIDQLEKNMLISGGTYETWKTFRDSCSAVIKEEIERLNKSEN